MTFSLPTRRRDGAPYAPEPTLFCLEIANNHQGSVDHGRALLDSLARVAERTGARTIVKLQLRELNTFLHPADRAVSDGAESLSKHTRRFRDTELGIDEVGELVRHARSLGLPIYATPFDEASVDRCVELGFEVIKIASCSSYDWPLLRKVAATKLPVICSVGGLAQNEVDDVVGFFREAAVPLSILHCVAAYPTDLADLQRAQVRQLAARYTDVPVGYSGHERPQDLFVAGLAVAKGAVILERHVGLPTPGSPLNTYSLDPEQTEAWIRTAQQAERACADGRPRTPVQGEQASLMSLRRGIYARRTIPAGTTVTEDDVYLAMPCLEGQFHSGKLYEIVGSYTPFQTIYADMPLGPAVPRALPKPLVVSSIAARVREMLADARIPLEQGTRAELSHQYGFARFFEVGAVIIDVVNRDYCKKLIIQFPNQHHPGHRHHQKEETFQLLTGSLHLTLDDEERYLEAGETQLVERGRMHSFWTDSGVIFEEISTTHIKGDSEYEDKNIPSDPTTRKTPLEF